ncbi:MAG: cysteine synthase family protein [Dehalococcoidia bacterium]|nr:cysteine synthase family protein [Dehalococcoidia bacterium]
MKADTKQISQRQRLGVACAIGNTPLVPLENLDGNPKVRILGKLEGANLSGSVKDRPALYMLTKAEESGELTKDKIIVEATSGNMGIALAAIGAAKGYRLKLFMPECVSQERQRVLMALGAEVVLTPAKEGTDGAIRGARRLLEKDPGKYYMPNQFDNENNSMAHYVSTGPEIFAQTNGEVDVFLAGMGTTGTLMGTGRYLKEKKPKCLIVGVEPTVGHTIQGLKNMEESIVPRIYHPEVWDEKVTVEDEEAFETTRLLATREGLFLGMSSGAAVAGALRLARQMSRGTIVVILPDRGDRYLSTTLFRSICAKCPP